MVIICFLKTNDSIFFFLIFAIIVEICTKHTRDVNRGVNRDVIEICRKIKHFLCRKISEACGKLLFKREIC